ncbi:MAG: MOSC N-terminal beta barrel domain-containing protein [Bacteroidota bacterium]
MKEKIVSEIYIYPVKSLGGISVKEAEVTERGFKYDRRWMLIDSSGKFLTQRSQPLMALIKVDISKDTIFFRNIKNTDQFSVGITETTGKKINSLVWNDQVELMHVNSIADEWFSQALNIKCKLLFMPDETKRKVDSEYASNNEITSLSDGYPFLIIGQPSLDDLNRRLIDIVPANRFRPNLVFTGGAPFEEDEMKRFTICDVSFFSVKQCSRCVVITINQNTAQKSEEPLRTLSSYRNFGGKVNFGMNLLHSGSGIIKVGDEIKIVE